MAQDKKTLEEITSLFTETTKASRLIIDKVSCISLPKVHEDIRTVHPRGGLIKLLILLKLMAIPNIHNLKILDIDKLFCFGKDVLYKLKNSSLVNWRKLLLHQSRRCMDGIKVDLNITDPWKRPCFIADDSDIPKTGKFIELIGRVFSHVTSKFPLGFKSMNLCYWSGSHLLHVDFSYHIEKGKNGDQGMKKKELRQRYSKKRKASSPGAQRVKEATQKKTSSLMAMISRAVKAGFPACYVLVDSWFFNSQLVQFVLENDLDIVSRPKWNQWKYVYKEKPYTLGELIKKLQRQRKYKNSRQLRMRTAEVRVTFQGYPVKLFFYKDKKRGSKWNALVSTDKSLGAVQAFKVYQNRWAIEVAYKEIKQHLGYGQSQSRDFDGQISDAALSLMAYNELSYQKAINDYESIGYLFAEVSQDWLKPNLIERFWSCLYELLIEISEVFNKDVQELIKLVLKSDKFFSKLLNSFANLTTET